MKSQTFRLAPRAVFIEIPLLLLSRAYAHSGTQPDRDNSTQNAAQYQLNEIKTDVTLPDFDRRSC